jgi:hypothetical protein
MPNPSVERDASRRSRSRPSLLRSPGASRRGNRGADPVPLPGAKTAPGEPGARNRPLRGGSAPRIVLARPQKTQEKPKANLAALLLLLNRLLSDVVMTFRA